MSKSQIAEATRTVIRTGAFWLSMAGMLAGIGLGTWFTVHSLGVPLQIMVWVSIANAFITVVVVVWVLYRVQSSGSALGVPLRAEPELARAALAQEVVASLSILAAAAIAIYFMTERRLGAAALTLVTGLVIWQAIRVALKHRRRRP